MKKMLLCLCLFAIIASTYAQRIWETQLGLGVNSPSCPVDYDDASFKVAPCLIIGKGWYKKSERKLSLRKEFSMEFIQTSFLYKSSSKMSSSNLDGNYYGTYFFVDVLPQAKIAEGYLVVGPRIGYLMVGYEKLTWSCSSVPGFGCNGSGSENRFNRERFGQFFYGAKFGLASVPLVKERLSLSLLFNVTYTKDQYYAYKNLKTQFIQVYALLNIRHKKRASIPEDPFHFSQ